jgi:hypothetical protein
MTTITALNQQLMLNAVPILLHNRQRLTAQRMQRIPHLHVFRIAGITGRRLAEVAHTAVLSPWSCRGQKSPKMLEFRAETPASYPQPEVILRRVAIFRFLSDTLQSAGPQSQTGADARHYQLRLDRAPARKPKRPPWKSR